MAGLRRLHRIHRQTTRFIGRARKNFEIQTHEGFKVFDCRLSWTEAQSKDGKVKTANSKSE
jgi:hypothetical protein